jgi:hypothetical protein
MGKVFSGIIGGVVGFFIGGPMGAAIGFGLGSTKAGEKLINKVLDFVTKPFLGAFGVPNDGGGNAQREEGVVITKQGGGTVSIPVVYGFRQVGGVITFATTGSDKNKYLWVAYVLSEGPVEGIHQLFIDDNDITTPAIIGALNRGEQVDITSGKYNGRVKMQFWYGKNFGTNANLSPVGANAFMKEAPGWRTSDAYNGLATLFVRYEWKQVTTQAEADNNPFTGSIPMLKVNLLGRRVLPIDATAESRDWITDVNAGRERYSTNPAEIILDYLRNPFYGKGLSNDEIDWLSFQTARNKYNQDVTYVNGVKGPILTTNMVLDTGATLMSNVKTMLQGCRSYMPYVQGTYKLKVEDAGNDNDITSGVATVVATFTPDNIVGDISWGGVPRDSVFSEYEVTYVDPLNKWATNTVTYPTTEAERLEYQVFDGGRLNKGATTLPTITNYAMAYDMARLLFFKSRTQETLNLKVTSQAFELEPGDNIQVSGNTLTFVTGPDATPWRIVSIKANDDYTFDLGCVSNPDSIYPHSRAGERDIIIPPYIPKYESIIYPLSEVDLSIYPPSHAYTGDGAITSPLDPPGATDPTTGTGGGVGDQNGNQNQNPITVPPPPPPAVVEVFNHYIDVTKVDYTVNGNVASATLTFKQPDSPSYAGVDFWISSIGGYSPYYVLPASTDIPGAGRTVTYTINNLTHKQTYRLVARVKYSNGNSSTFATRPALNSGNTANTGDIPDYPEVVGPGWQPGPVSTYTNPKNTILGSLSAVASLDGSNNRVLAFTINQDISVQAGGVNPDVNGMIIYYKLNSATYWKQHTEFFNGSYVAGNNYSFTPNLDIGVGNPGVPGENNDPSDNYDFIFRFTYKDGTQSTKQWRYKNIDIQPTWNFSGIQPIPEDVTTNEILTEEQAPPGSVVDARNMTIGLTSVGYRLNPTRMVININPPDSSNLPNWYGVKVRVRQVPLAGGTAPEFVLREIYPVPQVVGTYQIEIPEINEFSPTEYQIIITPVVRYSGAKTEANTSWIGQGKMLDTSGLNQFTTFNFKTIESAQIPGITAQPFPTSDPIVFLKGYRRIARGSSIYVVNNEYLEISYNTDHIVGLTGVRIYRRSNIGDSVGVTSSKHFGLGRWEYIDVDTTTGTGNAQIIDGNVVVNLRYPISSQEFNPYYLIGSSTQPLENNTGIWGAGKKLVQRQTYDIFIVAQTSSGFSSRGQLMAAFKDSSFVNGIVSSVAVPLANPTPLSTFDSYTAGYKRNITPGSDGSRANLTGATLWAGNTTNASNAYSAPTPVRGRPVI